jgi:hypothetical protein
MGVTVNFRWRRKYYNVFQVKQHLWHLDKVECVAIVLGRIAAPAVRCVDWVLYDKYWGLFHDKICTQIRDWHARE